MSGLAWESLTEARQIRRLRLLAFDALSEFPVDPLRLSLVGGFTNVIFRVDTEDRPLTWDRVFCWPEEVDPVVLFDPSRAHHLAGGRREVLDRSIAAVEAAFAKLGPAAAQVIHGDLHPDNVHVYRNRLIGLDFEDVTWGHRVQDVAITLFYERGHEGYDDFRVAFEEGYRTVAEWPVSYDGELEHFMAARTIMFVNYVANLYDDPSGYYDIAFPRLNHFLETWAT